METQQHTLNKKNFFYVLVCLLLGWSYLVWAYTGYSQGEPDALWFLPSAVSFHNGDGLYNRLHEPSQVFDPAHEKRFLFYPAGMQLILSSILPEGTGRGAFLALAMINFMSLILSALLFYRILRGKNLFLGIFGMIALSTYLGGFRLGRPDFLATFLVLLMTFAQGRRGGEREISQTFLMGVLAFVHPVAALFAAALLGMAYAYEMSFFKTIIKMCIICGGGMILFLLLMFLSPHGLVDSFRGIFLHSQNTMVHGTAHPFWKYWVMHSYASCYGILLMTAAGISVWMLWENRKKIASVAGVFIFGMILAAFFSRFVAAAWDRCYNLWVFAPLMIAVLLMFLREGARWRKFFVAIIFALCSIGYLHSTALFGFYLKDGYTYENARGDFQKFMSEHPDELVGVSKSLWVLSEEYERMRSFGLTPAHLWCKPNWIILQQRFFLKYTPEPPAFEGYELVSHNFTAKKPVWWGVQLSPTMPGYFYAVYRRIF